MADKLKPCPFCGSTNVQTVVRDYLGYVKCLDCRAQGGHWQWHSATVCEKNRGAFDEFRAAFIESWNNRPNTVESQTTDIQQLKAEIRAICIELECTSHDKFDCGMYHALRGRLSELSAFSGTLV